MKILIIEDEAELLTTAKKYLHAEGHVCEGASTFREGFERIIMYQYDCVVADIGLPDGNGIKLVEKLKSTSPDTGIIIISARNSLQDKVLGLDVGADDYLTKPFHLSELNARIKSILRRRKFHGSKEIVFNEIKVIPETFEAYVGSRSITLTKKELDLLIFFISNTSRVLTKESIAEHLWGDYIDSHNSYDFIYNHISNLRKKLIDHGASDYIQTVYGAGYKFANP